ncbi:MAG: F0F1 ATP synthase subunit epsilon [Phycisphaeraceae bacterium]|nr:F0F1 ATP synthase subunit epsilon [Phycisphaeraceae bacterium]
MADAFRCSLVTPERQLFDEEVVYASIPAWDGQLGLMHQRAPLLAKLGSGPLRLDLAQGGSKWFFVGGGYAQMKDNNLSLVTGEARHTEEIVRAEAEAALKEAEARIARSDDEVARKESEIRRARGLIEVSGKK